MSKGAAVNCRHAKKQKNDTPPYYTKWKLVHYAKLFSFKTILKKVNQYMPIIDFD